MDEVWLGFYKKTAKRRGLTYPEAVDAALCFGWIDGIRKSLDEDSYTNRFTPRKPGSIWSNVNVRHVERLTAEGLMQAPGLAAFARRDPAKSGIYSFETRPNAFPEPLEARFRAVPAAWAHFNEQPPGYRRLAIYYVISAKREETRSQRLERVIQGHKRGVRLGVLFGQTASASDKGTATRKPRELREPREPREPRELREPREPRETRRMRP